MADKERRQYYLDRNVCLNCGCRPLKKGYLTCEVCYEAQDKWMKEHRERKNIYNKTRYDTLKALGLCPTCKNKTEGNVFCRKCTDDRNRYRATTKYRHTRNKWAKR